MHLKVFETYIFAYMITLMTQRAFLFQRKAGMDLKHLSAFIASTGYRCSTV